jgi:Subtilase family
MINPPKRSLLFVFVCVQFFCIAAQAQFVNTIGLPQLQSLGTNLNGTGIHVGQPEAPVDQNGTDWEVNPAAVPQSAGIFTYNSNNVTTNVFPNSLGGESWHADEVGQCFYGPLAEVDPNGPFQGVATNVAHIDNYNANYFVQETVFVIGSTTNFTITLPNYNINDPVVNQSFIFENSDYSHVASNEQAAVDMAYDTYAAKYNTLFISGAGNGTPTFVSPPATCYNGIGVGVYNGASSIGPTTDNGRCQPEIVASAPGGDTSFSTPYVAGSAAVLMQAGLRGDGGGDTNSAANMITVKALLLNGAVKPADWANVAPSPLDYRYGAGMLNVFNSYEQLAGGKHGYNFSTNYSLGASHLPVSTTAAIPVLNGWDCNTNTSSTTNDEVNHYFFNVTNGTGGATFSLTATLVWNLHQNKTAINNLSLYLYNTANNSLFSSSTSVVDNVQHVFVPKLPQGRYDLQVRKAGGGSIVSASEPYALAWAIFSQSLKVTGSGTNLFLSWPIYPAGFAVAGTANLNPSITWSTNNLPSPVITNSQNVVWLSATNSTQFFRLQAPNF